jgi:lipopolysaccharide export system protein LptC
MALNLRLWVRDRKIPVAIIGLAALALSAQLVSWWLQPQAKVSDFVGPPRSGYVLHNFVLDSWDETGKFSFKLTAPQLDRRDGDDSLYLITPDFVLPSKAPGTPDWTGNSRYGWVDSGGDLLKLQGDVHMHRVAYLDNAPVQMDSSDMTAWPKENRVATDARATVVQGSSTMTGVGMHANLDVKHLELFNDSHITFLPTKKKS